MSGLTVCICYAMSSTDMAYRVPDMVSSAPAASIVALDPQPCHVTAIHRPVLKWRRGYRCPLPMERLLAV
eukprot:2502698-Rhodomonas_salina.2